MINLCDAMARELRGLQIRAALALRKANGQPVGNREWAKIRPKGPTARALAARPRRRRMARNPTPARPRPAAARRRTGAERTRRSAAALREWGPFQVSRVIERMKGR